MIKKCFIVQCRGWAEKHLLVGLKLLSCDYKKFLLIHRKIPIYLFILLWNCEKQIYIAKSGKTWLSASFNWLDVT